jgi:uncharacterized protein
MNEITILLLIGLFAGLLSGFVGVGGGIIIVPALIYFLNYTQLQAQGTSLGVLALPVVLFSFLVYYYNLKGSSAAIDLKTVGIIAAAFVVGSVISSKLSMHINQATLSKLFAILLFYTGFKMLHWDKAIINFFSK